MSENPTRFLIFGVPRSGKSRLAARLTAANRMNQIPVDSLVSALGDAYPQLGVGRQYEDADTRAALAPLLRKWVRHLDYERIGYVLEGYHVEPAAAAELASRGLRVAALGYAAVDARAKYEEIRRHDRPDGWTGALSDPDLLALVRRFTEESAELASECSRLGLDYFDVGEEPDRALDDAFAALTA